MRGKYSAEIKIDAVKEYLDGHSSQCEIARRLKIDKASFRKWIMKYNAGTIPKFV